jgi:hypothetical protein
MLGERGLQVGLVVAMVASVIVLLGLFSDVARVGCLVVMAGVVLLSASARAERGGGWWVLLAVGVGASIAGAVIAQGAQTIGGLIAVIGGVLVVIAAAIGLPVSLEEE